MAKKRGTGFKLSPGAVAVWRHPSGEVPSESHPINFAFNLPEHNEAFIGGLGEGSTEFLGRYAGGGTKRMSTRGLYGQGWWGELIGNNEVALIEAYNAKSAEHKAEWDGIPTPQEIYDYALTTPRPASVEPADTRPMPEVGTPVEVLVNGAWVADTVKGFSGQVIAFNGGKARNRQKGDRDKTWRIVGETPTPAPAPEPPKPPTPGGNGTARPKIPPDVWDAMQKVSQFNNPVRRKHAMNAVIIPWATSIADPPPAKP